MRLQSSQPFPPRKEPRSRCSCKGKPAINATLAADGDRRDGKQKIRATLTTFGVHLEAPLREVRQRRGAGHAQLGLCLTHGPLLGQVEPARVRFKPGEGSEGLDQEVKLLVFNVKVAHL